MNNHIYQHQYINLDKKVRDFLIKKFNITRTGITEIIDDRILSDGITNKDLEILTELVMTEYVGSHESFGHLWDLTIQKLTHELNNPIIEKQTEKVETSVDDAIKASGEKKTYCGACISKHGHHSKNCITKTVKFD